MLLAVKMEELSHKPRSVNALYNLEKARKGFSYRASRKNAALLTPGF